jgi:hypothetical protein
VSDAVVHHRGHTNERAPQGGPDGLDAGRNVLRAVMIAASRKGGRHVSRKRDTRSPHG